MKMENKHGGNGFVNGFVLGAIIGAGVVFLLGTKKGKQLLKTITEEGIEGVSEIKDIIEAEQELEEEELPTYEEEVVPHTNGQSKSEMPQSTPVKKIKRFFRGAKK